MKKNFGIIIFILLVIWSILIEPNLLTTKKYKIPNTQLAGMRIVFISDLHIRSKKDIRVTRIISKIEQQNPDILLFGGDFLDGTQSSDISIIADVIARFSYIKTRYGTFSILGNHEWLVDRVEAKTVFKKYGIELLSDENKCLVNSSKNFCIVGLEDILFQKVDTSKAMDGSKSPIILLSHSPDIFKDIPQNVNLVLAGHTHGGQVNIPLIGRLVVPSDYGSKYAYGLIEEDSKKMIVTSGIGTSILPIRFNCPPEIVVVDFI